MDDSSKLTAQRSALWRTHQTKPEPSDTYRESYTMHAHRGTHPSPSHHPRFHVASQEALQHQTCVLEPPLEACLACHDILLFTTSSPPSHISCNCEQHARIRLPFPPSGAKPCTPLLAVLALQGRTQRLPARPDAHKHGAVSVSGVDAGEYCCTLLETNDGAVHNGAVVQQRWL